MSDQEQVLAGRVEVPSALTAVAARGLRFGSARQHGSRRLVVAHAQVAQSTLAR